LLVQRPVGHCCRQAVSGDSLLDVLSGLNQAAICLVRRQNFVQPAVNGAPMKKGQDCACPF